MLTVDLERLELHAGQRVLDLGCGEGRHVNSFYMLAAVDAVGVDLCFDDLNTAASRAADISPFQDETAQTQARMLLAVCNGLRLPFADHSFDVIVCSEVLEHVPDYVQLLDEIVRVLKPGGQLCVSVPRYWPEKICWLFSDEYHQVKGGHLRIFKTSALKRAVCQRQFKFLSRHWAHALHTPFWWLKCLFWSRRDTHFLIRAYHRFLVWDMLEAPRFSRTLERCLNPVLGKSVVLYFKKMEGRQ